MIKKFWITRFVIFLAYSLPGIILPKEAFPQSTHISAPEAYKSLQTLPFDNTKIAQVKNLTLRKDRARLTLKHGTIYLTKPVLGKITGAVFLGEGIFELMPPTKIERKQVRRFLDKDSLSENFSAAYLRFTDDSASELMQELAFESEEIPKKVSQLHEKISELFLEDRGVNLASGILGELFNSNDSLFIGIFEQEQPGFNFPSYLIFTFDASATEEVSAYQYFPNRINKPFHTLCSFHQISDYKRNGTLRPDLHEDKDAFKINHYEIKATLKKNKDMRVEAELTFVTNRPDLRFLTFDLIKDLEIDSVKNSQGDSLFFLKEKKETGFSVHLKNPAAVKKPEKIIVYYSGEAFENISGSYILKNNVYWLPRYGYFVPATFDITFTYPEDMNVASIGKRIRQWSDDDYLHAQWREDVPSLAASFAFGRFDSTTYDDSAIVPVKVYSNRERSKSMREKIAGDVANSLFIFENLLGDYPYSKLDVVEIPGPISNGFPGILFLTFSTFVQEFEGVMEALRGHEVSHQWWGNLVGWQTYHDQWLSEGLGEYSGALITQFTLDGDKRFFQILESWRNDLLERGHIGVSVGLRRFGFSKSDLTQSDGMQAGPVWLGRRLGEKYPVDYYLNVYEKGAYVIHMLRTLMRDFETGSDEKFWNMLADYVQTYKSKRATTEDFQEIVEKHFGENMDWFFDQWVYGTSTPTYIYSYTISNTGNQYRIELKVRQEEVPDDFQMQIPVAVKTQDGEEYTELIHMQGREKSFHLGPFLSIPKKVEFNAFGGVLAKVKKG